MSASSRSNSNGDRNCLPDWRRRRPPRGHVLHGVDCLPDLIEVNSQVFVPNASMGGAR